jgi:hypothetical protein
MGKTDPYIVAYIKDAADHDHGHWHRQGETNKLEENLNPEFETPILVNYVFQKK